MLNKIYKFFTVSSFALAHFIFASVIIFFIVGALFYSSYPTPSQFQKTHGVISAKGGIRIGHDFIVNQKRFTCLNGFINNGCSFAGESLETLNSEVDGKIGTIVWYSSPKLAWLNQRSMLWFEIDGKQYFKQERKADIEANLRGTLLVATLGMIIWFVMSIIHLIIFLYKVIFKEKP